MAKHVAPLSIYDICLADTGKGTVAKLKVIFGFLSFGLADTGKGTVAKLMACALLVN